VARSWSSILTVVVSVAITVATVSSCGSQNVEPNVAQLESPQGSASSSQDKPDVTFGPYKVVSDKGYMFTMQAKVVSIGQPTNDVGATPGRVDIHMPVDAQVSITNSTPSGQDAPESEFPSLTVGLLLPDSSVLCGYHYTPDFQIVTGLKGGNHHECFIDLTIASDAHFANESLAAGSVRNVNPPELGYDYPGHVGPSEDGYFTRKGIAEGDADTIDAELTNPDSIVIAQDNNCGGYDIKAATATTAHRFCT
jgi:hypothetical protein